MINILLFIVKSLIYHLADKGVIQMEEFSSSAQILLATETIPTEDEKLKSKVWLKQVVGSYKPNNQTRN